MPRIPDQYLDCSIYLYGSEADAHAGERTGGSGFLASVPSKIPGKDFVYAVTNAHVIESGCYTVRLNTQAGQFEVRDFDERNWIIPDNKDDIAVCVVSSLDEAIHKYRSVPISMFALRSTIDELAIGPGDDTFTVGRFVNADGKQRNTPSARAGTIAQMPWEPITQTRIFGEHKQESYLVEARSISGFSGSPVFLYFLPFANRPDRPQADTTKMKLLGVQWGYILDWETVKDEFGACLITRHKVQINTGMMGVVPAWILEDLLMNHPHLKARRQASEAHYLASGKQAQSALSGASPNAPSTPTNTDNPAAKEAFTSLLRAAVQKQKPSE